MTLENYVKLESEVEKILRFKPLSYRLESREIPDPITKEIKTVSAAVIDVTHEDGTEVSKTFSTLSSKLASTLNTMHRTGELYRYDIGIIKRGSGFGTTYSVRLIRH